MSDFNDVLDGNSAEQDPVETPQAEQQAQPEQPETPEQPEAAEPEETPEQPAEPEEPTVPLAVFKSMREDFKSQLDSVRSQLNQPKQEPVEVPDVLEDPQQFQEFIAKQITQSEQNTRLNMSRFMAEREFGAEKVEEVVDYFNKNPTLSHQFMSSPSPFHAAKDYVDAQKLAAEIGDDPASFRAKVEAETRKKIEAEMAAKQAQEMAAKVAPSLANTNGSGGKTDPGWSGPVDLNALIGE